MDTKLTLKLEENIIIRAKKYARYHHQSLSKLVEIFFHSLTEREIASEEKLPPTVKSLAGILTSKKRVNLKNKYTEYLIKKYD